MYDYKIIPPKQKYLTLSQIETLFGSHGVVAYGCRVMGCVPLGGHVIAVQNKSSNSSVDIKKYMRQFKAKYSVKEPIYYIRLEPGETDKHWLITYDHGGKEVKTIQELTVKKSSSELALENAPFEIVAQAIQSELLKTEL